MFPRDEICPYSEKKFASGVNFSRNNIFSPIISSAISSSLIMLYHEWTVSQIMHFKDVKNFACKSGSVKFWTNNVSVRWSRPQIYIALSLSDTDGNWIASSKGKANVLYFHHSVVEVIVEPEHMRGKMFVAQAQWKISPHHCHSRSPGDQR